MTKAEKAAALAEEIAADNKHGYLWGGNGPVDFDCSGLVNYVYDRAGVPVNSELRNTTFTAPTYYPKHGFIDVTNAVNLATGTGMKRGDVLINRANHMAIYVGGGQIVQARSNYDGKTGDGNGQEIRKQGYYNYPWDCVLRHQEGNDNAVVIVDHAVYTVHIPLVKKGDTGDIVKAAQLLLIGRGYYCGSYGADGDFGNGTLAGVKNFQAANGLEVDGEIGGLTWAALLGVVM